MKARLRSLAAGLLLSGCSFAVCLLIGELALRLLAPQAGGGKEQLERNRYTEYDPVLGWRKKPGVRVAYQRREYRVEYTVNSLGLRGPERPHVKPAGGRRVLALGDSFVEAFMVDDASTVSAQLESALQGEGCRAEVLNGGTVGYSTDQEYLFYRDEGRRYAPDVVVLFVYHNDLPYLTLDHYNAYPKPLLDFEQAPPAVANAPVPRYEAPPPAPRAPPQPGPPSYLVEFVKDRLERSSARTYNRLAAWGVWEPLRKLPMNEELNLYHVPELGHLRPAWSAFTWTVQALARQVAADGGKLVVAYIPSRMEVSDGLWELTQERYGLDARFQRAAVGQRVKYIAGRLGVPFLDLTASLAAAEGRFTPTYFATDSHWNARGQRVAARALAGDVAPLLGCR